MRRTVTILAAIVLAASSLHGDAQDLRSVIINEVAWAGTDASANDEWLELLNNTDRDIDLTGWVLRWADRVVHFGPVEDGVDNNAVEVRNTVIPARGFYLLERTDDTTISDIDADLVYTGSLSNGGATLELVDDRGNAVDSANAPAEEGWLAGAGSAGEIPYASMERINPRGPDSADNWVSNNGVDRNGLDANGDGLNGTPKARNSSANP